MFWVRWHNLWKIGWLLRIWRRHKLATNEQTFLRNIRKRLRNHRELSPDQQGWLDGLYERKRWGQGR